MGKINITTRRVPPLTTGHPRNAGVRKKRRVAFSRETRVVRGHSGWASEQA